MTSYLYGGTLLKVDLSSNRIEKEPTARYERLWLGGRGLNARILYQETEKGVDPLGPENVLLFSLGPFTGSMVPGSGRVEVAAKSPVTGIQGMSNMGGYWGSELKYAGYDSLIVKGSASAPVYLAINNDAVEIRDASHLWGLDTYQTQDAIRKELADPEVEVACIGPAGENLVSYASVQTRIGNAAGRTGMGTVMGSKNLKAVAVRGTKGVCVAEPERFLNLCLEALQTQKPLISMAKTTDCVANDPPTWALTLGNYEATEWSRQKALRDGHKPFWEKHRNRQGDGITGCFNCQVRCMDYYDIAEMGPLVASCNIYASTTWLLKDSDMESWYAFASRCQRQGVDVMSAARMIAWAMELFESGQISTQDTDGLQLTWGNREAIGGMLDKIVKKEGFGNILSSTMDEIPRKIVKQVEVPLHIKGVPLGGTNVMNFRARAIGAAVNPRGSDEYRSRVGSFDDLGSGKDAGMTGMASPDSWEAQAAMNIIEKALKEKEKSGKESLITQFDYEGRGSLAALATKISAVSDALGQCKWNTVFLNLGVSIAFQANALSAGLGRDVSVEDLMESASRLTAQERAYAAREGYTREQDQLPEQLLNRQLPGTWPDDKLTPQGLESMKDDYYSAMGWHIETGIPTAETLHALKLDDVIEDLWTDTEKIAQ